MKKLLTSLIILVICIPLMGALHTNRARFKLDNPGQDQLVTFDSTGRLINVSDVILDSLDLRVLRLNIGTDINEFSTDTGLTGNSDDALPTERAVKSYADALVTAQDLDFAGDTGTGAVDLDSQTFTLSGTTNEINTSASGQTITIGLPDSVVIADDINVTNNAIVGNDVILSAPGKVSFDGASPTTYVSETSDDMLDVYVGGTNIVKIIEDTDDTVKVTAQLNMNGAITGIQNIEIEEDAGLVTLSNQNVSATPADGTPQAHYLRIDNNNCFAPYGQANSSGGVYALGKSVMGAEVTTTDATVTTLDYFTMPDNSAVYLEVKVIAMESDGSSRNVYHLSGLFYRNGGDATQQGTTNSICEIESETNCACVFDVSGNTVRIRVTGVTGETWKWTSHIENIIQE